MTFLEKLKEIESHLQKIEQVNGNIRSNGRFTSLENDIVKEHLRELYELYDDLRTLKGEPLQEIVETPVKEAAAEKVEDPVPPAEASDQMVKEDGVPAEGEGQADAESDDEPVSLFEKFKTDSKEVNTSSLSDKPLKEIIPLNDKFMFIKEFFDNSISKYDEMLDTVEQAGKKDKAVDYMKKNVWSPEIFDKNEELIDRFIKILDSKFKD